MYHAIVFLPLIGFLIAGLFGRRIGPRASEVVTSSGARSVDHAALSQLRDAAPFPRPAPNTNWRTRDFTVRIDFRALTRVS